MNLAGNDLSGALPSNLGDLRRLTELDISNNELTGAIPSSLGNISNLRALRLDGNRLTGSIPSALCKFASTINPQQGSANLPCDTGSTPTSDDRAALVEFYNATDGPNWSNNSNWGSNEPLGRWNGVETDSNGRVIALRLRYEDLNGTIPSSLGNLTNLRVLFLRLNRLRGPIPSSLGNLTNLTFLDLSWNELTGSIPSSLGNLTEVRELFLTENQLTGTIPSSLANLTSLDRLQLRENRLTGSIPAALCKFAGAINPQQGGTNLPCGEGSTPTSDDRAVLMELYNATDGPNWRHNRNWGSNEPLGRWDGVQTDGNGRVTDLNLIDNRLIGTIPASVGNLTKLKKLVGYENRWDGPIPSSLGNLTNLEVLALQGVAEEAPEYQLTGAIPASLGRLTNLRLLDLKYNGLTGAIPTSLGNLSNLTELVLAFNQLSGTIPAALCKFASSINPQGGVNLPCVGSASTSALEAQLVPGDGELAVHWTAASDSEVTVSDYDVRYRPDAESAVWTELSDETNGTVTSATIAGLTNGTAYHVQVRADDGAWSATAVGIPEAPKERLDVRRRAH